MNKHGVSRRCFTEADVKDFKSGALRTITNITKSIANWKKKVFFFPGVFYMFSSQNSFLKWKFL